MTPVTTNQDQTDFVDNLIRTANMWLGPLPADCVDREPLRGRLDGFAFSLFQTLEGGDGIAQCRLSPKGHPGTDLVAWHMHHTLLGSSAEEPDVRAFLAGLAGVVDSAVSVGGSREVMGRLAAEVCRIVEDGYELRFQYFADDDRFVEEGDDIAPGLVAAFQQAWTEA